jgi:N-acetylglucosamine malate deacetylase 2
MTDTALTTADLLDALQSPGDIDAAHVALVVAHPDDETIGLGGQLHRMRGVTLVHLTDGAPSKPQTAQWHGFDTPDAYAAARRAELEQACDLAGVLPDRRLRLGVADQEASFHLVDLARRLAALFAERGIEAVFTHPYEGGHPDHDACAFAVRAAAALCARDGWKITIREMTFYHARPDGFCVQAFAPIPAAPDIAVELAADALARRAQMVAAHATQAKMLAQFTKPVERYRAAPAYDFSALPNGGLLHYANYDWGMSGERWLELTGTALAELRLGAVL